MADGRWHTGEDGRYEGPYPPRGIIQVLYTWSGVVSRLSGHFGAL